MLLNGCFWRLYNSCLFMVFSSIQCIWQPANIAFRNQVDLPNIFSIISELFFFWLCHGFVFYRCHYDIKPTHNFYFVNKILRKPEFLFGCGNLHTHVRHVFQNLFKSRSAGIWRFFSFEQVFIITIKFEQLA